jgi:short-subunit dehydrogenase
MTELRGARTLVTGASGGLGRAISLALHREGAQLVLTGRRAGPLDALAAEVGGRSVVADLASRADLERLLAEAGPLDVLVANAAVPASGDLAEWEPDQIDRAVAVNLTSSILMARALLPAFRARRTGHFVFVSSLSGKAGSPGTALYSATKFGLRGLAAGLRADLAGSGVGCSCIFPAFVGDAGMFADTGAKLPFGFTTVTSNAVARGVVRAIRTNRAEIDVAPFSLRAGAVAGSLFPGMSAAVQARVGRRLSRQIVDAQKGKH